ncbi:hypothetical protein F1C58_09500 [Glaciihabitans sp. INWT7]|uniref:hypothetical protein n=1 Tax=Glaciihabitans sp. INWT7 TaxID=2596912 RepID=UPI001629AECF|nr:hypothetical protein [Glaciihabitans sp. INWT7]QNE47110.1 hypothetical protein F1C58_09500 [Glaciihabitans sp. INWT7]
MKTVSIAARYVAASALIAASILVCCYLTIMATFVVGSSLSAPDTTEAWVREIALSADLIAQGALWSFVGLAVTMACALVGVRWRKSRWMWVGIACSALFACTLLLVTISGPYRLDRLVERATAAIENGPAVEPAPPRQTPPPQFTAQYVRSAIQQMAAVSQRAAVGPVTDMNGAIINFAGIVPMAVACEDSGSQGNVQLDFRTGNNARSRDQILAAWDSAGYAPDRAIQEDLRYSATLPIARMTIRDSTTIDGLIHMNIVGQCATP